MVVDLGKVGRRPAGATSYYDRGLEESMPWYAQRDDLPDTHRHHANEGSQLAAVYERLGYVEVSAPGAGEPDEVIPAEPVAVELEPTAAAELVDVQPAGRKSKAGKDA